MAAHSGPRFEKLRKEADFWLDSKHPTYGSLIKDIITDSSPFSRKFLGATIGIDSTRDLCWFDSNKTYKTGIDPTSGYSVAPLCILPYTTTMATYYNMNGSSFTVWFKTSDNDYSSNYTGRATILGLDGGFLDLAGGALWLQNDPPYKIFGESSTNNENWIDVSSAIPANSWNNLTCVFSGGNTATSYLNGVEIDEVTNLTGSVYIPTLGGGLDTAQAPGVEYTIYARWDSKALTYDEIQDLHIAFRSRHGIV